MLRAIGFSAAALAVIALLRLNSPGVPDPDSFYHFRHAAVYADKGLAYAAFPWLPYSVLARFSADIGYGFHVFLIPFTLLQDQVFGVVLASVIETLIVLIILYATLKRHRIAYPFAWPFVLLFLASPIIWTVFQTRPQTLSMGFVALLLSSMLAASAPGVLASAFLIGLVHLNVFFLVPFVVVVAAVIKGIAERRWQWPLWLLALVGIVAGWLLRPNPLGVLRLERVQILVHEVVRHQGLPLLFGREWLPVSPAALSSFLYFIVIWAGLALLAFVSLALRRHHLTREDHTFLWSTLAVSAVFFVAMLVFTKRATPFWAICAVMFSAKAFTCFLDPRDADPKNLLNQETRPIIALAVLAIFAAMIYTGLDEVYVKRMFRTAPPDRLRAASLWLKDNAQPDDTVFNVDWGMFPELFFWNTEQRYVSGLDPIFLYAYSPKLYWETHYLQTGEATDRTWEAYPPQSEAAVPTYTALRRDFDASYLILAIRQNPRLYEYLRQDPRFALGFADESYAVFALRK